MTDYCQPYVSNPLSFAPGGIGLILLGLAIHGVVTMTLLVVIDCGFFHNVWYKLTCIAGLDPYRFVATEDVDVEEERQRVRLRVKVAREPNSLVLLLKLCLLGTIIIHYY